MTKTLKCFMKLLTLMPPRHKTGVYYMFSEQRYTLLKLMMQIKSLNYSSGGTG